MRGRAHSGTSGSTGEQSQRSVYESAGVAEALMRGGIANYMSTYWPVGDDAAETFSETFYKAALAGSTIGSALLAGRRAVLDYRNRDWADYILYGNFDFVLKTADEIRLPVRVYTMKSCEKIRITENSPSPSGRVQGEGSRFE